MCNEYQIAQRAMADLKAAIHMAMGKDSGNGMTNAEVGRSLGIYQGHVGHEGHIPRTLLGIMESEGVVEQDSKTKKWRLRKQESGESD